MMTHETCKLRYCRPSETATGEKDWLVERISRAEATSRKQKLEQMGCVVELIDPFGNSADSLHARFGARLDPRPRWN